jgi:hypothetical protein
MLSLVLLYNKNLQVLLMPVSDMSVVGDEFNTTLHNSLLVR